MQDRTTLARVGLTLIALSLFAGRSPIGLLPLLFGLFLPKFKVLGWWLTVVLTTLLLAITFGTTVFLLRGFHGMYAQAPAQTLYATATIAGTLAGCTLTLLGLLAKGTRHAVEQRTRTVAPGAFDR